MVRWIGLVLMTPKTNDNQKESGKRAYNYRVFNKEGQKVLGY